MLIRLVICPMCGRTAGSKRDRLAEEDPEQRRWRKGPAYNLWRKLLEEFKDDKPFGVIMSSEGRLSKEEGGRGTIRREGYFQPEEDGEYFHLVKTIFLRAIAKWVKSGWLTESEIAAAARGVIPPPETFVRNGQAPKRKRLTPRETSP